MSVQFLKPAGPRLATSQTDTPLEKIDKIPWYIYFLGAAIYTAFAGWLLAESSPFYPRGARNLSTKGPKRLVG
jgi:hypothetical protein